MEKLTPTPGQALAQLVRGRGITTEEQLTAVEWTHDASAQRTKSSHFHGELVGADSFRFALQLVAHAGQLLDLAKRAIYYGDREAARSFGKATGEGDAGPLGAFNVNKLRFHMARQLSDEGAADVIHSIIGSVTESAEKAELLLKAMDDRKFDVLGFIAETGDGRWYDCIGVNAVGWTTYQTDKANERKLQDKAAGRYKEGGFTAVAAVVRNTNAEDSVIDKG